MNCFLHCITVDANDTWFLSPLDADQLKQAGIASKRFAGRLADPVLGPVPGNVDYNPDFLLLLHETVRDVMATDPEVIEEAEKQPNGFVFIIDRRSQEGEAIKEEDIIGIFLVHEKQTDAGRYRPNPDYRFVTERGFGLLPVPVEEQLMRKLME